MKFISLINDDEAGVIELWKLEEESADKWNGIKDDKEIYRIQVELVAPVHKSFTNLI